MAGVRQVLALAENIEKRGGPAVVGLGLTLGSFLVFIGLEGSGPSYKVDQPELILGAFVIIGSFFVFASLKSVAANLRASARKTLAREELTLDDLPEDER